MTIKRDLVALVFIIILSVFAIKPLLSPGYFSMHDNQHVARLFEFDKSLKAGQFPVRWVEGLGFGYGYPLFNFYPPLTYYVGEASHLVLQTDFITSIKVVWFLALVGSGITMYFFAKEFFGRSGGIIAAVFYMYAPYHAVDAYVRGALAELASFVWLPLILLFAYKTAKDSKLIYALWTGLTLALLMLTHNLIFLPFFGVFALWFGAIALIYKHHVLVASRNFFLATALAFGLSAFFWLPAILEKQFTLVDSLLIKSLASYTIHFLCPSQLWESNWGFGGSAAGCIDGISFKLGKLHILAALLALGVALINKKVRFIILTGAGLFVVSVFMTTSYSRFVWDGVKELWYLQFPWRFLEFAALFSSFLAGSLALFFKGKVFKAAIAATLVVLLLLTNATLFEPQSYYLDLTDRDLTSKEEINWKISATSFEYMPQGVVTKVTDLGTLWVDIDETKTRQKNVVSTNFNGSSEHFAPHKFVLRGMSQNGGQVQVQQSNFPGWQAWVDGTPAQITDSNPYKLITLNVPKGSHEITGQFRDTPVRTLGNTLSLISIGALAFCLYGIRRNSKQNY